MSLVFSRDDLSEKALYGVDDGPSREKRCRRTQVVQIPSTASSEAAKEFSDQLAEFHPFLSAGKKDHG